VAAGGHVELIIPATVTTSVAYLGQTITNTAYYYHASGQGSDEAIFSIVKAIRLYLPLVARH
jgi:hypothetical protein